MRKTVFTICLLLFTAICPVAAQDNDGGRSLSVRANLLRWATLTPDIGLEWSGNGKWSVLANGTWTHWSWSDKDKHHALWEASLEVRRYLGEKKRTYLGVQAKAGQFNYKLSYNGKQGDLYGGGLTGGYKLPIGKRLELDFSIGLGYLYIKDLEKYDVINSVRVFRGKNNKGYLGVTNLGVVLSYEL